MRSVITIVSTTLVAIVLAGVPAEAATKVEQGDSCKKVGKEVTTTTGKGKKKTRRDLVCVLSISGKVWWQAPKTGTSQKQARQLLRTWRKLSSQGGVSDMAVLNVTTPDSLQADLARAVAVREDWAAKAHEASTRLANLRAESAALPGRLQAAAAANESAKEAHEESVAIAERELATLNAMYPEYSSALDAQYGGFGPGLRCSFGELEYCAEAAAYDALRPWASSVISRYNVQASVADAAIANMGARYQEWENRYAEWQQLSNRSNTITAEIQQAERDTSHASNLLQQSTEEANRINERVAIFPKMRELQSEFKSSQDRFNSKFESPKLNKVSAKNKVDRLWLEGVGLEASNRQVMDMWTSYVN